MEMKEPVPITDQHWPEGSEPLVTVRVMAFQHARFIRECMEGLLAQCTTFPVRIAVHDDASDDGTSGIIASYAARFPSIIKAVLQTENTHNKPNKLDLRAGFIELLHGKYTAICEGDDYWIDPLKLQDQIGMLEADASMTACVSDAFSEADGVRTAFNEALSLHASRGNGLGLRDILTENIIPTASVVFRRDRLFPRPKLSRPSPAGDWVLLVHLAKQGRIGILNRKTVVRRCHPGGSISMKDAVYKLLFTVRCLEAIEEMVGEAERRIVQSRIRELRFLALEQSLGEQGWAAALAVWDSFKGRGLPLRQYLRWYLLLHWPRLMAFYTRLRS